MKKDNGNEERLIEFLVTIGSLIFFAFLSMYAMRGCEDGRTLYGEETKSANMTAVPLGASIKTDSKNKSSEDVSLEKSVVDADAKSTTDAEVESRIDSDAKSTTNADTESRIDSDAESTSDGEVKSTTNGDLKDRQAVTTSISSNNDSEKKDDIKKDISTAKKDKSPTEAEEEAGIIADIESERVSVKPYVLKGIYFRTGASYLTSRSKRQLDRIAKVLKEHEKVKIILRGHTDNLGTHKANKKLSLDRASSVGMALVDRGVSIDNIWIDGMGETEPITSNGTPEEMLLNRRVDIAVIK